MRNYIIFFFVFVFIVFILAFIIGQDYGNEEGSCEPPSSLNEENQKLTELELYDLDNNLEYIKLEVPQSNESLTEQIVYKKAFVASYNKDTKCPNWVAWHLTDKHTDGPYQRRNIFYEDDELPKPRATLADYKGSGWSRGHMCPAGDNKWDETAMVESFSLINVCPQNANLNSGLWNRIEIDCRNWANRFGDIYIVCGPLYLNREHKTIGENKVVVPEAFFKVVLCLNGTPKAFGFIVRNTDGNKKNDLYYNSVDEVEKITGMDFFPSLPDDIEDAVESSANIDDWK